MLYKIHLNFREDHLHVQVTGKNDRKTVEGYLWALRRLARQSACPNLLIEENLEGPGLPIRDVFRIVLNCGRHLRPDVRRIAYVDVNPAHDGGLMRFAGHVAFRMGIDIHVFRSVLDAEQWMRSEIAYSGGGR